MNSNYGNYVIYLSGNLATIQGQATVGIYQSQCGIGVGVDNAAVGVCLAVGPF